MHCAAHRRSTLSLAALRHTHIRTHNTHKNTNTHKHSGRVTSTRVRTRWHRLICTHTYTHTHTAHTGPASSRASTHPALVEHCGFPCHTQRCSHQRPQSPRWGSSRTPRSRPPLQQVHRVGPRHNWRVKKSAGGPCRTQAHGRPDPQGKLQAAKARPRARAIGEGDRRWWRTVTIAGGACSWGPNRGVDVAGAGGHDSQSLGLPVYDEHVARGVKSEGDRVVQLCCQGRPACGHASSEGSGL